MKQSRSEYSRKAREQKKLSSYPLVYKIVCNTTGIIYIGSTTQKLYDRKGKHMWDYRNRNGKTTAYKVMENNDWDIYEVEKVDDKSQLKLESNIGLIILIVLINAILLGNYLMLKFIKDIGIIIMMKI